MVVVMVVPMLLVMMVVVVMCFLLIIVFVLFFLVVVVLYRVYPRRRGGHLVKVEAVGAYQTVQLHIAVVAGDDVCLGLYGAEDVGDAVELGGRHLRCLVEQDDVAKLNLLDDQVLNVFFANVFPCQLVSVAKLIAHAQRVYHGHDAVEPHNAVLHVLWTHRRDGADGLCDGGRLADAARLDDNVVEPFHRRNLAELLDQVHLERAADAPVLQGHQTVVLLVHNAALLDKVGVDVYLAYVIDDHGKPDAALVGQYPVE